MEKIISRISRLKGRQLNTYDNELSRNTNQISTALSIGRNDYKTNSLNGRDEPNRTLESDVLSTNDMKQELSNQKVSRKDTSVFLIENYAELLIQKLRHSNGSNTKLPYYFPNNVYNRVK